MRGCNWNRAVSWRRPRLRRTRYGERGRYFRRGSKPMLERVNAVQNTYARTSRGGESDDDRLARPMVETLEAGPSPPRGRPRRVLGILPEPLASISRFPRGRRRVTLDCGKTPRVFF